MVIASELKSGVVLRIGAEIYRVLEAEFKAGAAKLSGVVKVKLENVITGSLWERTFRPQERLEDVQLEQRSMEFLFSDADNCTLMNPETGEQIEVPRAMLGAADTFLQSGAFVQLRSLDGRAISALLPAMVEARIVRTAPAVHAHQDSAWKEAALENGFRIRVPLFIAPDDVVRVDVRTGRYVERVHVEHKKIA